MVVVDLCGSYIFNLLPENRRLSGSNVAIYEVLGQSKVLLADDKVSKFDKFKENGLKNKEKQANNEKKNTKKLNQRKNLKPKTLSNKTKSRTLQMVPLKMEKKPQLTKKNRIKTYKMNRLPQMRTEKRHLNRKELLNKPMKKLLPKTLAKNHWKMENQMKTLKTLIERVENTRRKQKSYKKSDSILAMRELTII